MQPDSKLNNCLAFGAFHDQLCRVVAATQHRAHEAGLEPLTFKTLLVLKRKPAGVAVGKLAKMIGIDRNATVELVDRLVRRRFVTRHRDVADRRRVLVTITDDGAAWMEPVTQDALREVAASGPDLMRTLRLVMVQAGSGIAVAAAGAHVEVAQSHVA